MYKMSRTLVSWSVSQSVGWPRKPANNDVLFGSGPEGAGDLCFHICRNFSSYVRPSVRPSIRPPPKPHGPIPGHKAQILASRPKSQPWGPNLSLAAKIPALRPISQPWGPNPSLEAQIPFLSPSDWDLGLKAEIWALRLEFGPQGWDLGLEAMIWVRGEGGAKKKKKKEKKKEKIPHMCDSIGHRLLRGRCPKIKKLQNHEFHDGSDDEGS